MSFKNHTQNPSPASLGVNNHGTKNSSHTFQSNNLRLLSVIASNTSAAPALNPIAKAANVPSGNTLLITDRVSRIEITSFSATPATLTYDINIGGAGLVEMPGGTSVFEAPKGTSFPANHFLIENTGGAAVYVKYTSIV